MLLLTEWPEYVALDPVALKEQVAAPRIIDGRNCLDPVAWRAAGWTYRALGGRDSPLAAVVTDVAPGCWRRHNLPLRRAASRRS